MNFTLSLPRFTSRQGGHECRFQYGGHPWTLSRRAETIGDDALVRLSLFLDGRELDPFTVLSRSQWQRWEKLPYEVPYARLCPGKVPSALLCEHVATILDAYLLHPDKASCFWPIAA